MQGDRARTRPCMGAKLIRAQLASRGRTAASVYRRGKLSMPRLLRRGGDCLGEERGRAPVDLSSGWSAAVCSWRSWHATHVVASGSAHSRAAPIAAPHSPHWP